MKLGNLLKEGSNLLEKNNFDEAGIEAEVLLADSLNIKNQDLYLSNNRNITTQDIKKYKGFIKRRLDFEPVQYITEKTYFMGLEFLTPPGVFIPRPETEQLVMELINYMETKKMPIIFDIGTGSGVIGISAVHFVKDAFAMCSDISFPDIAQKNAQRLGVGKRTMFIQGDLFGPYKLRADFIVSNPPYIKTKDISSLQKEIKEFEPLYTINGGLDSLHFIKEIIKSSPEYLEKNGMLFMEIGDGQAKDVRNIALQHFRKVEILNDLSDIPRILIARK